MSVELAVLEGDARRGEWQELLARCDRANLLQTWEYGEAKRVEGWQPVRMFVKQSQSTIGAVQALVRRYPLVGGIMRINRAPLLVDGAEDTEPMLGAILSAVRRRWVDGESMVLFIAPEAVASSLVRGDLESAGFAFRPTPAWMSGAVALDADDEELRRRLERKWRNHLTGSAKSGVVVGVDHSKAALEDFMIQHRQFRQKKGFAGISDRLLSALREQIGEQELCTVFQARLGVRTVAGIVTVGSGSTATLLLSWNSPEGREALAGNAMLWRALLTLRDAGYRKFDVGGLGPTPAIDRFKRGLNPVEYTLVGELIAVPRGLVARGAARLFELVA